MSQHPRKHRGCGFYTSPTLAQRHLGREGGDKGLEQRNLIFLEHLCTTCCTHIMAFHPPRSLQSTDHYPILLTHRRPPPCFRGDPSPRPRPHSLLLLVYKRRSSARPLFFTTAVLLRFSWSRILRKSSSSVSSCSRARDRKQRTLLKQLPFP